MPMLTDAAVRKYRPTGERRLIKDATRGLYLCVYPSGQKSFLMRLRGPSGKAEKITLGQVAVSDVELKGEPAVGMPLTLAGARLLATKILRDRSHGNPIAEHKAAKKRHRLKLEEGEANSFAAAVRRFVEQYALGPKIDQPHTRQWRETARMLGLRYARDGVGEPEVIERSLVDRWGDRPITSISGDEIFSVVQESEEVGIPGLARAVKGRSAARGRAVARCLGKMFRWLHQRRKISANPCLGIYVPDCPKGRDRVLTDDEIRKFYRAALTFRPEIAAPLHLLLLTGCRLREVTGMRRSEISEDGATWTIPGSRTKNHREHVVPLSAPARLCIESMIVPRSEEFVFSPSGRAPVDLGSKLKRRLDDEMKIPPWRVHDLRRTAASGMAGLGIPPHVVEACLNHISGAKAGVAGVYNRYAYEPEKRAALARWADHVEGLAEGRKGKVLLLHKAKSQ